MKVEAIAVDSLTADPANVRTHDARNLESIKGSLAKFGQQKPIVVDGAGVVVAGNGTLQAARLLGWSSVDVVRTRLEGAEAVAYAIADNRTAELAAWDDDALASTLASLQCDQTIDEAVTGFDRKEIDAMIGKMAGDDAAQDDVPDLPADPTTKPGDLILLGDHRLLCGDSTNADDVARLVGGCNVGMCLTDPPYGVDYTVSFSKQEGGTELGTQAAYEESTGAEALDFLSHAPCRVVVMTYPVDRHLFKLASCLESAGFDSIRELIWLKQKASFHPGATFQQKHEPVLLCRKGGAKMPDIETMPTIIQCDSPSAHDTHPTAKPVRLWSELLAWYPGAVFDPFLGSGTTIIAAEQLGRKCYGLEISPVFCDVIVQRWENMTGKKAKRQKGGA